MSMLSKSIKAEFLGEEEANPAVSSFINFLRAVKSAQKRTGKTASKVLIYRSFNSLVNKNDYALAEREKIVNWVYGQTA